jgi:hypothetical protein
MIVFIQLQSRLTLYVKRLYPCSDSHHSKLMIMQAEDRRNKYPSTIDWIDLSNYYQGY